MIVIHIITENENQVARIGEWLLREKLVHQSVDIDYQDSWKLADGALVKYATFKLSARTKALLFMAIEAGLTAQYGERGWCLYSTPVLNMDKENQTALINATVRV
jgi:hypothetical protein